MWRSEETVEKDRPEMLRDGAARFCVCHAAVKEEVKEVKEGGDTDAAAEFRNEKCAKRKANAPDRISLGIAVVESICHRI